MNPDLWALADRPPPPAIPGQLAVPDGPAIGSVCTGYGGLDMAVQAVLGGHLAWVADPDPGAAAILTHHHPTVPNLGDIIALDWATVPPVDVLCGGYPCQPFSVAGRRKGTNDARHLWPFIACALRVLRPRLGVFENVAGHLRLGFDTVLRDLAAIGFDAEWVVVSAAEVGAAHQRKRLWLAAWPADAAGPRFQRAYGGGRRPARDSGVAADAADLGHERLGDARGRGPGPANSRDVAADAEGLRDAHRAVGDHRVQLFPEPRSGHRADPGGYAPGVGGDHPATVLDWGRYAPAIARWEAATSRPAPWATDPRGRLSPLFVEWLMGLPAGHVTAVPDLTRTQQLKALGNGVVPAQAAAALRLLLARTPVTP